MSDTTGGWLSPEAKQARARWNEGYEAATNELVAPLKARVAELERLADEVGDAEVWLRSEDHGVPIIEAWDIARSAERASVAEYTDTHEELAMAGAYIADLTAELERYERALRRICTGQALDPHMSHDPVALSECPVAYCIARQALQEQSE